MFWNSATILDDEIIGLQVAQKAQAQAQAAPAQWEARRSNARSESLRCWAVGKILGKILGGQNH